MPDDPADPDIDDAFRELEELEELVDSETERDQVRETMRVLRRARRPLVFGRLRDDFDLQDAGEALVGSFLFGIPMIVEDGTLDVGAYIAGSPLYFATTVLLGLVLVLGILQAVGFTEVEEDMAFGVLPVRVAGILAVAAVTAIVLMTIWGRVDWSAPRIAAGQVAVTAIVMAVGASLGDVLPGT